MKIIGIVAGRHQEQALRIKAAILKIDAGVEIMVDDGEFKMDEAFKKSDCKINNFNAVERLASRGAQVVAFSCGCPHGFMSELQTETTTRLVDPCDEAGVQLSPEAYAAKILATDPAPLPKPFKVGLVGGLGPAATVDLYDKITRAWPAKNDQEHFKVVIEQNPQTPDRTKALLEGGVDPTLALYHSAKRLQEDGCDYIIIPCNTAHAFVPFLERHLETPFINMQQTTLDEIKAKFGDKARIGLLATSGTVRSGLYSQKAEAMGLPLFAPDEAHQKLVMSAIYGPEGVKAGFTTGKCRDELLDAARYLVETYDCNVLILGCTELPLILNEGDAEVAGKPVFFIDPTSALARRVCAVARETINARGVI